MNCSDFEISLCDYLDGTLRDSEREVFEAHLRSCPACKELAGDAAGALAFMERAAEVLPPQELLTRISFAIPSVQRTTGFTAQLRKWFEPILQPKFAMGMAMTILSFSMLGRFAGIEVRDFKPSDLNPVKVWEAADDRVHRSWARAVKYYENLLVVYEIKAQLREWNEQEEEAPRAQQRETGKPPSAGKQESKPEPPAPEKGPK